MREVLVVGVCERLLLFDLDPRNEGIAKSRNGR